MDSKTAKDVYKTAKISSWAPKAIRHALQNRTNNQCNVHSNIKITIRVSGLGNQVTDTALTPDWLLFACRRKLWEPLARDLEKAPGGPGGSPKAGRVNVTALSGELVSNIPSEALQIHGWGGKAFGAGPWGGGPGGGHGNDEETIRARGTELSPRRPAYAHGTGRIAGGIAGQTPIR